MRRSAVLILSAVVLAGACRKQEFPPDASATTATLATTTQAPATTTTIDVAATPAATQLQDPAYWNAVLASINQVVGDAFRSAVRTGSVEPSAVEALSEVYGPNVFENAHESLVEVAGGTRRGILDPPGDAAASVTKILKARAECVALVAFVDYRRVNATVPSAPNAFKLVPRGVSDRRVNPTPWTIAEAFLIGPALDGTLLCSG